MSDLKTETRINVKPKPRRALSIVSNTADLRDFPVGLFAKARRRCSSGLTAVLVLIALEAI